MLDQRLRPWGPVINTEISICMLPVYIHLGSRGASAPTKEPCGEHVVVWVMLLVWHTQDIVNSGVWKRKASRQRKLLLAPRKASQ